MYDRKYCSILFWLFCGLSLFSVNQEIKADMVPCQVINNAGMPIRFAFHFTYKDGNNMLNLTYPIQLVGTGSQWNGQINAGDQSSSDVSCELLAYGDFPGGWTIPTKTTPPTAVFTVGATAPPSKWNLGGKFKNPTPYRRKYTVTDENGNVIDEFYVDPGDEVTKRYEFDEKQPLSFNMVEYGSEGDVRRLGGYLAGTDDPNWQQNDPTSTPFEGGTPGYTGIPEYDPTVGPLNIPQGADGDWAKETTLRAVGNALYSAEAAGANHIAGAVGGLNALVASTGGAIKNSVDAVGSKLDSVNSKLTDITGAANNTANSVTTMKNALSAKFDETAQKLTDWKTEWRATNQFQGKTDEMLQSAMQENDDSLKALQSTGEKTEAQASADATVQAHLAAAAEKTTAFSNQWSSAHTYGTPGGEGGLLVDGGALSPNRYDISLGFGPTRCWVDFNPKNWEYWDSFKAYVNQLVWWLYVIIYYYACYTQITKFTAAGFLIQNSKSTGSLDVVSKLWLLGKLLVILGLIISIPVFFLFFSHGAWGFDSFMATMWKNPTDMSSMEFNIQKGFYLANDLFLFTDLVLLAAYYFWFRVKCHAIMVTVYSGIRVIQN